MKKKQKNPTTLATRKWFHEVRKIKRLRHTSKSGETFASSLGLFICKGVNTSDSHQRHLIGFTALVSLLRGC